MDGVRRGRATALPALALGQRIRRRPRASSSPTTRSATRRARTRRSRSPGRHGQLQLPLRARSRHNVVFFTKQPTSCTQTAGDIWQPAPPLPWYSRVRAGPATARSTQPGTYEFRSGLNWNMRGTVIVVEHADADADADATRRRRRPRRPTPTPPTPTPTPTPTATPTPTPRTATPATRGPPGDRRARHAGADAAQLVPGRCEQRPGGQQRHGRRRAARSTSRSRPARARASTTSTSTPTRRSCTQTAGTVIGAAAAAADVRAARGLGGQLHVQHARHLHVRLLDAPRGDDRHGDRRRAAASRPRRRRRRRPRRADARSRRVTRRRPGRRRPGRRSTSRPRRR